jgi:hypothetical protein
MLLAVRAWILLSALLVGAGWILSAFHELNRIGYGIAFALAAAALFFCRGKIQWPSRESFARASHKFSRRFKRPAPLIFFALALMSLAGGALYVSTDGDSMAYRIPRVLHWLNQGQWHWIRTLDFRMNIAGCGFEWLSAPLILFTRTDRLLFLINWISFLMLPGLIFSVFTRLQVRPRVAWWWMWFLSSGWCYAMQAGSLHNDSFAVVYALAAVDLALRAKEKNSVGDFGLSMLAAALLTGVKQTDIPLALLWLVAAWPAARLLRLRPAASLAVVAASLLVSALPLIFSNLKHCGTWTGIPDAANAQLHSPFWAVAGNIFCIAVQNLLPPFFPWADGWNAAMQHFLQTPFGGHFTSFESFGHLGRGVSEGNAGIGLGICVLIFVSLCAQRRSVSSGEMTQFRKLNLVFRLLHVTPWLLLLLFMAKVGTFNNARQLAPYYVFFFPLLLANPHHEILARRRRWQQLGLLVMLITAMLLAMLRSRPMFPAKTLIAGLQTNYPQSKMLSKMSNSYAFISSFEKLRGIFKSSLPPDESVIGYATVAGNAEIGLSLPPGRLKIERLLPDDTPEQLRLAGIHYVAVDDSALESQNETLEQWMTRYDGELVDQVAFLLNPNEPQTHLYLVRLRQPSEQIR